MDYNTEKSIMKNKKIDQNAKKALDEFKIEAGEDLYLGGLSTRKLVEIGEQKLMEQYKK